MSNPEKAEAKKGEKWPRKIAVGNVTVKIYRMRHETSRSGWTYVLTYNDATGRRREKFSDVEEAAKEARLKAAQLNAGRIEGASMSQGDRDELQALRSMAGKAPLLSLVKEWLKANELTGGNVLKAAQDWKLRNVGGVKRITVPEAVDAFIKAKDGAGKQGYRTYISKLKPLKEAFPDRSIETVTGQELGAYLSKWSDGSTRNDIRKRTASLWKWAYSQKYLPQGAPLEIHATERAAEKELEIGTLTPDQYRKILIHVRDKHPAFLAGLVLAGFCGIRADEIHGKRADRSKRQTWENVNLERKFVLVEVAKKNTASRRIVPLCDAAVEWLMLCSNRTGPVIEAAGMEKLRLILREAKFTLPENCFRHSFISARVAQTSDVAKTSLEAGNSPKIVFRHYREVMTKEAGEAWFSIKSTDTLGRMVHLA